MFSKRKKVLTSTMQNRKAELRFSFLAINMHSILSYALGYRLPKKMEKKLLKKHTMILGKTWSGKSEWLKTMIYRLQKTSEAKCNRSLIVLDPHGQLVQDCLRFQTDQKQLDRIIYIEPWNQSFQIPCINPFREKAAHIQQAEVMAQERTYAFLQLIGNASLSLQMKTILEPCLTSLFLNGQQELATLQKRMKADMWDAYFENLTSNLPPILKKFFEDGFYDKRYALSKNSIYTKIQSIQNHDILFHMLNGRQTINLEKEIQTGKVIIFNLSKGQLGYEVSSILSKLIMATLLGIVFRRQSTNVSCYLFVDEMQLFTWRTISHILSEARKKKLFLIGATQSLNYFPDKIKNQLATNTSVQLIGSTHPQDVQSLTRYWNLPKYTLSNLKKHQFILKYADDPPTIVSSPHWLVGNNNLLKMSYQEVEILKQKIIIESGYYRAKSETGGQMSENILQPKFSH